MQDLIHLHTNSEYSFLDSTIKLKELFEWAQKHQKEYLVLTDRNALHGLATFVMEAKKLGIKAIIGLELDLEKAKRVVLIAKNYQGYEALVKLSFEVLEKQKIALKRLAAFENELLIINHPRKRFQNSVFDFEMAGIKNYYLSDNDINNPRSLFIKEIKILKQEDSQILKILNFNGKNNDNYDYLGEPLEASYEVDEKMKERIFELLKDCAFSFKKPLKLFPSALEKSSEANQVLKKLTLQALNQAQTEFSDWQKAMQRLEFELKVIADFGFAEYFLIFYEIVNYAKKAKILIGPGRGSAAGSLVAYLLKITKINPLKYGLYFERFLNPERQTLPDIDIDIQDDRREEIINYLRNFYGYEKVATISTYSQLGARSATRDVARYLKTTNDLNKVDDSLVDQVSKALLANFTIAQNLKMTNNQSLQKLRYHQDWAKIENLLRLARGLENLPRQIGTHAAGLIIASAPLSKYLPIFLNNKTLQIQFDKTYLEALGFIKLDLLGLINLTIIQKIETQILEQDNNFDTNLDPENLKNDAQMINLFNQKLTLGIFQIESTNMTNYFASAKVSEFKDIYDLISLYRPGPKDHINEYLVNKTKPHLIKDVSAEYNEIVKNTHGILIYQEQIMEIVQKVAGLSLAEADTLRRAISKKDHKPLQKLKIRFFEGAKEKGYKAATIKSIYANIASFAAYGFNKSHAVAYAFIVYKTAYYKAHYPFIFYKTLINSATQDKNKIYHLAQEAKKLNLKIESPEINHPDQDQKNQDTIYLPFLMINSFGQVSYQKLLEAYQKHGPFSDFAEAILRLRQAGLSDATLITLVKASVFRNFGNTSSLLYNLNDLLLQYKSYFAALKKAKNPEAVEIPKIIYEEIAFNYEEAMRWEKYYLGNIYNFEPQKTQAKLAQLKVAQQAELKIKIKRKKVLPQRSDLRLIEFSDNESEGIMWINTNNEYLYEELEEKKQYRVLIEKVNSKKNQNVFKILEIIGVSYD